MDITVSGKAVSFFQDEMGLKEGQSVRFSSKVYGKTEVHEGLSVSVLVESPHQVLASTVEGGIQFFIEEADEWFFNGYHFHVDYDEQEDALTFKFEAIEE